MEYMTFSSAITLIYIDDGYMFGLSREMVTTTTELYKQLASTLGLRLSPTKSQSSANGNKVVALGLDYFWNRCDVDGSGEVDYKEFVNGLTTQRDITKVMKEPMSFARPTRKY